MLGSGTKDRPLCELTADVCGIGVMAGPVEATVMGSAAMQLLRCEAIQNRDDIPEIIRNSEELHEFFPKKITIRNMRYSKK